MSCHTYVMPDIHVNLDSDNYKSVGAINSYTCSEGTISLSNNVTNVPVVAAVALAVNIQRTCGTERGKGQVTSLTMYRL